MYYMVEMSNKWYAREISDIASYEEDLQALVNAGDIVSLTDDIEYFASILNIDPAEIEMVGE